MSRNQRLSFLGIAAVIAVIAVIVLVGSGGSDDKGSGSNANATATATETGTATPATTPTATATPTPKAAVLTAGKVTKLRFKEGDPIRFQVSSDKAQEVHVHGYDLMKDTVPGKPITFAFKASITGIFVVEFEESGEQIGELRVDPK